MTISRDNSDKKVIAALGDKKQELIKVTKTDDTSFATVSALNQPQYVLVYGVNGLETKKSATGPTITISGKTISVADLDAAAGDYLVEIWGL